MSFTYKVRMIQGSDTCTTITSVEANTPSDAAREAEMKWTGIRVQIVNVELLGDCCWDSVDCTNDHHYCPTCDTHLETDGECTNCHY